VTRRVRLRRWQKTALEAFDAAAGADFLAVATPGAGKTTFALTAAVHRLAAADGPRRLVVVAPTAHLKRQWAAAATAFGVHLDPRWAPADGDLPADMHGVVTTYQQVAACAPVMARLAAGSMVVFDEVHHAGDERAWGEAIRTAFERAAVRLALSGTPFRSDTASIPFVRYQLDEARPDFEYGYGQALSDGRVARPVYFPRTNGHMEWSAPDGARYAASFDEALGSVRANQRLRTALSLDGEWLPAVLGAAHDRLGELRRDAPDAGGLVIASDVEHAHGIAGAMARRFGVRPVVATSDDAGASDRIAAFGGSDAPWLVAVRMVSEGVDIPRLRVGVYATTTTTELFFRQAVGRLVRWSAGEAAQRAYLFIPDDARLRAWAFRISELRRHSLRRDDDGPERAAPDPAAGDPAAADGDGGQLSLFAVISAVATGTEAGDDRPGAAPGASTGAGEAGENAGDDDLDVDLPALGGLRRAGDPAGAGDVLTRRERKARLRDANAVLARSIARRSGWSHAQVNAELNRLAGVRRVTEATVEQLERRLRQAERWHSSLA
jgi:superfamily II DNA or RNA helicase